MHEIMYSNSWVKVKKSPTGFFYLERKGKDSIAILPYRYEEDGTVSVLIRNQPLVALGSEQDKAEDKLGACPITGTIEHGDSPSKTAVRELQEEAGYIISVPDLMYTGCYVIGTQTNEVCYCYLVDITNADTVEVTGDGGYHESISTNTFITMQALVDHMDNMNRTYSGLMILGRQLQKRVNDIANGYRYNKMYEKLDSLTEKINPSQSFNTIVQEIMASWEENGKIGEDPIENKKEAIKKAVAIAYKVKGISKKQD
jgi:8-oxo-dGTP pyrophosphatase MutT (NUDIX family)